FHSLKVIKAFRVKDARCLRQMDAYNTDAWLLDAFVPDAHGGTGATFNWTIAREAKDAGYPVILAGGLFVENVAQAVHEVWPYGVDVSSGVETAPGRKDAQTIRDFIAVVRGIESERY
ncbi:MAG: N-(5'-phosphoribosyl)anthranilate isomerase, partial [Pedosphaera parvula]|nr:N-(5'-phosphoribosyl)anthranilate isomerase [Pedosphaera parvula]